MSPAVKAGSLCNAVWLSDAKFDQSTPLPLLFGGHANELVVVVISQPAARCYRLPFFADCGFSAPTTSPFCIASVSIHSVSTGSMHRQSRLLGHEHSNTHGCMCKTGHVHASPHSHSHSHSQSVQPAPQSQAAASVVKRRRRAVTASVLKVDDLPKQSTPLPAVKPSQTQERDTPHSTVASAYVPPPVSEWHKDSVLMSGCEPHAAPLNVAVLLSGGVDSSLALRLLVAAGHKCTAFYLQIWFQEDFRNFWDACPWEEDLKYAQEVCDSLGVPLEVVPMTSVYWDQVVASSVEEIRQGRTPNPDVLCNSRVKFGAFVDHLARLEAEGRARFDRVASGHYARVVRGPAGTRQPPAAGWSATARHVQQQQETHAEQHANTVPTQAPATDSSHHHHQQQAGQRHRQEGAAEEVVHLCLTPDPVKDQTYFLAHLSPRQLSRAMFPLGTLTKAQVRALASAAGLATQSRKDSQGICFLGKVKFGEFVKEHLGEWQGLIVEEEEYVSETTNPTTPTDSSSNPTASQPAGDDGVVEAAGEPEEGQKRRQRGGGGGNKGGKAPTVAMFGGRRVLGVHQGYWFYTVGQRGGIKLPGGPWYVVRKDCDLNIVYVSRRYYEPGKRRDAFLTGPFSWLSDARPDPDQPLLCKVRHGPNAYQCELRPMPASHSLSSSHVNTESSGAHQGGSVGPQEGSGAGHGLPQQQRGQQGLEQVQTLGQEAGLKVQWDEGALVVLDGSDQGLAAGQYAVLYQGGVCLGSAQIQECVDVEPGYSGRDSRGAAGTLSSEGLVFS